MLLFKFFKNITTSTIYEIKNQPLKHHKKIWKKTVQNLRKNKKHDQWWSSRVSYNWQLGILWLKKPISQIKILKNWEVQFQF